MSAIPKQYRDLLEGPVVVSLATLMEDGMPQVQPVWCGYDGTHVLVNTEKGRQKYRNLTRRKKATVLAVDPKDDTRWLEIRGSVEDWTEEGAFEHLDDLARRYIGAEKYPFHQPGDVRVIFRIRPERVVTMETAMPDFGAGAD